MHTRIATIVFAFGLGAAIAALEQNFDGRRLNTRPFQHQPQWHAGPFGVTDRAGPPLHAMYVFLEEGPPVAGAFDRREHGSLG